MVENKKFKITKKIDGDDLYNKLAALGAAYHCALEVPDYDMGDDGEFVMGMKLLYKETLVELELLLFGERYAEDNYIEKAELVVESKEIAV